MKSRLIGVDLIALDDLGTQRTLIVRTNIHGRYTVKFKDVKSGRYILRAAYAGSSKVQRMESIPLEVVVP
jgi:hypothetical protein